MFTYSFRPLSIGSSMPRPTETPPASAAPLFAASMIPGPPPVMTAYPAPLSAAAISSASSYCGVPGSVRAEPKTETAMPSSASSPKPSTNSAWMRITRQGSVCTQSEGPRLSSSRWSVVVAGICLSRSVTGPWRRTRRVLLFPFMTLSKVARSGVYSVIAQDGVELGLAVPAALRKPPQHEQAGHAVLASGELARPRAADAHRPCRDFSRRQLVAGLHVDHVRRLRQDRARAKDGAFAHPRAAYDHAPGPDHGFVLDDDRHRFRWFEHAAYPYSAGQMHVLPDL